MDKVGYPQLFVLIARLILASVFVSAALPKIQDPVAFSNSVEGFRVIGTELSNWVALILPWLELIIGIGILLPWIRRSSSIIMSTLLLMFITLHTSAWMRGLEINCGCFGSDTSAYSLFIEIGKAMIRPANFNSCSYQIIASIRNLQAPQCQTTEIARMQIPDPLVKILQRPLPGRQERQKASACAHDYAALHHRRSNLQL